GDRRPCRPGARPRHYAAAAEPRGVGLRVQPLALLDEEPPVEHRPIAQHRALGFRNLTPGAAAIHRYGAPRILEHRGEPLVRELSIRRRVERIPTLKAPHQRPDRPPAEYLHAMVKPTVQ